MLDNLTQDDIALVAGRTGSKKETIEAIWRLYDNEDPDIRTIAAQATVDNNLPNARDIVRWLRNECSSEVRGWLALGLAVHGGHEFIDDIKFPLRNKNISVDEVEKLYIYAALAVLSKSRKYLLEIMKSVLSENQIIHNNAVALCKMLIGKKSRHDLHFLDKLIKERYLSVDY